MSRPFLEIHEMQTFEKEKAQLECTVEISLRAGHFLQMAIAVEVSIRTFCSILYTKTTLITAYTYLPSDEILLGKNVPTVRVARLSLKYRCKRILRSDDFCNCGQSGRGGLDRILFSSAIVENNHLNL